MKHKITKKLSLVVLSVFMVNSVAMADGEPKKIETCSQLSDNNLTNTKKHKKGTSKNVFGTLFKILGVLCVIDKGHDIADWLIGDPYFKIGIVLYESETNPEIESETNSEMSTEVQILSSGPKQNIPGSYPSGPDKFKMINQDLDKEEGLMAQNISEMTADIIRPEEVEGQTQGLQSHAKEFRKASENLKNTMKYQSLHIFHGWINQLSEQERQSRIEKGKQYAQEHPAKAAAMLKNWPKFVRLLLEKLKS